MSYLTFDAQWAVELFKIDFSWMHFTYVMSDFIIKSHSSASLISRYILSLGLAAHKQQRPRGPNRKMYLEIREADERALRLQCSDRCAPK